ncbi:MAG: SCO family protein [Orrella sp.]
MKFRFARRRAHALVLGLMTAALIGCSDSADFVGSDISSGDIGQNWSLTDHTGQVRQADSFPGKVSLVFFGFTQCPDVCPAALAEISAALQSLGTQAQDVQVLMITVDPDRDTPELLGEYLDAFDQGLPTKFLGLTGTSEEIRQTAADFRAYYAKVPTPDGSYTMDHSASFYLIDQQGKARVLLSNQSGPSAIAKDIKTLLN